MLLDGALTVDLEDWRCALHPRKEAGLDNRPRIDSDSICFNTGTLLDLLDRAGAKATFFVPGEVARHVPELVKEVFSKGHEIASHSPFHLPVDWIPRHLFEDLLVKDTQFIEELTGVRPRGFRAPYFSVTRDQSWVLEVLAKHGFWYDSSVVPTWTPFWGIPGAPKRPYFVDTSDVSKPNLNSSLLEIPVSVWPMWNTLPGLPIGGGFYMRVWPTSILVSLLRRIVKNGGRLVLYIHPGNLESDKKRLPGLTIRDVLSQHLASGRGSTSLGNIVQEFKFGTIEAAFESEISQLKRALGR